MKPEDPQNLPDKLRGENITDAIATVIQAGHRDGKTSYEVAREVVEMLTAQ